MTRPDLDRIESVIAHVDSFVEVPELMSLVQYTRELEAWANRMPDAGITVDDPRLQWWYERPCAPTSISQDEKGQ